MGCLERPFGKPLANEENRMDLRAFIRLVPDFPKPGILFRDITPCCRIQQASGLLLNNWPPAPLPWDPWTMWWASSRAALF